MNNKIIILPLIFIMLILFNNCTEKITYSGKILNDDFNYSLLNNKSEIIKEIGQPNFVDPIENKYYYFSEEETIKNYFDKKITKRIMIVFMFNENDTIKSFTKYDFNDHQNIEYVKDATPNELFKRGLIEKFFGGVGNIPTTSN